MTYPTIITLYIDAAELSTHHVIYRALLRDTYTRYLTLARLLGDHIQIEINK